MKKTLISLVLIIVLLVSSGITAGAFNINNYEMHHDAGLIAYPENDTIIYSKNADQKM